LWATDAHIPEALEVIKAWGFKYVTIIFIWSKKTKSGKQAATLGSWTMKNCELCLFGTKGRMLQYKKTNNIYQLIEAARTKHSKKPEEARERIERLFGDLPRIELFAREKTPGWDVWGNEV
jgi:site-specific DNA-methyltransferase (adenine-specific)